MEKPTVARRSTFHEVPTDWRLSSIGESLTFISGKAHEPFVSPNGKYVVVNSKFISTDGTVRKYVTVNRSPGRRGDVLMVMSDLPKGRALAKCFLVEQDDKYAVNQRVCIFRTRREDPRYLRFFLNRNPYFMAFDDGVQQTHLLNDPIKKCPLVLPPVPEQHSIADALTDIENSISALERLIAKKQAIKEGMMQQLLTGRTRLLGFTGEWKARKFGELLDYEQPARYLVSNTDYGDVGIPVLTAGKTFLLGYTSESYGVYEAIPVIIFDDFTTDSKFVTFPFKAKSSAMKMLSARPGVSLRYVFERMQLIVFNAVDHKRRWIAEYSGLEVDVPAPDEQQAIAIVLEDAEREIDRLKARLAKARDIKTGMMQQLLTGRTRLPVKAAT